MANKKKTNIVAVSGYGSSGSSPLICALKELEGYAAMGTEFRLIKDPYGIESLESELIDNWHPLKADKAIRDFLWVSKKLNKKTKHI